MSDEVHWEEFDTKFMCLKFYVSSTKKWPKKSTVMDYRKRPFALGKWLLNKRYYARGLKKGGVFTQRNESIYSQMQIINAYKLHFEAGFPELDDLL